MAALEEAQVVELATEKFFDHLRAWLVQQPEWPLIMGLGDRRQRRTLAQRIAAEIVTIPTADTSAGVNRGLRRRVVRQMKSNAQV